ncbi:MAG: universal stress protein [Pseudomonadota bacterium]
MQNQTALYLMTMDTPDDALAKAAALAQASGVRLRCLLISTAPTLPFNAYGGLPYAGSAGADSWQMMVEAAGSDLKERTNALEAVLARQGATGEIRPILSPQPDIRDYVAASARTVDLAYLAPDLRDNPDMFKECVHAILFHSPVGVLLNSVEFGAPKQIFIAWNDSPAAANAVHAAQPLLKAADEIIIGCFDPSTIHDTDEAEPGADLATWLSHAGCKVTVSHYTSGGREIGGCILQRTEETGSDLVVMGAYGHSRMRQAVFGGTTRTLLEQTGTPIFMAH